MADPINLRVVRLQYLEEDPAPGKLRQVRFQLLEEDRKPVAVRQVRAQVLVQRKYPVMIRASRLQFLEEDHKPIAVRQVRSQVLLRRPEKVQVRGVRLQYLVLDNAKPDFNTDAWPLLLATINNTNPGFDFTDEKLLHALPQINDDGVHWNTKLKVTATPASDFSGSMYVYYQRYPIADIFARGTGLPDVTGLSTTHQLIPQLNRLYDVGLIEADIEDRPIDQVTGAYTLRVSPGSWYFIEGSRYDYLVAIQDLHDVYANVNLRGFDLPEPL